MGFVTIKFSCLILNIQLLSRAELALVYKILDHSLRFLKPSLRFYTLDNA